jgi:hypothetical protein
LLLYAFASGRLPPDSLTKTKDGVFNSSREPVSVDDSAATARRRLAPGSIEDVVSGADKKYRRLMLHGRCQIVGESRSQVFSGTSFLVGHWEEGS